MKKVFSWILMLTLVCSAFLPSKTAAEATTTTAKTYYVALSGDDSNDGTIDNPFQTLRLPATRYAKKAAKAV
ncbi:MAG: hypothetical protein ACLR23_28205 [Clostridia bacterium]